MENTYSLSDIAAASKNTTLACLRSAEVAARVVKEGYECVTIVVAM